MIRLCLAVLAIYLLSFPGSVSADLVPCGDEGQASCQTCHVVDLTNNVVEWLVAFLGTIAAILFVYHGAKLVTSGGNQATMESAKGAINNILIGYVIVLGAWLLLDYGLKALLADDETFGMWNEIECVAQPSPTYQPFGIQESAYTETVCDVGPGGNRTLCANQIASCAAGGTPVTITTDPTTYYVRCMYGAPSASSEQCDVGPSGGRVDCARQQAACNDRGGTPTINEISPTEYEVQCVMPVPRGTGSGTCEVVTDPANACAPGNLTCFNNANDASMVCNLESRGGNTQVMSGTDICDTGHSFSGGLWQINILANHSLLPGCSSNFFHLNSNDSAQGTCLVRRTNSRGTPYCARWGCYIDDEPMYRHCVNQTLNYEINTQAACTLYRRDGWRPWLTSARACNVI